MFVQGFNLLHLQVGIGLVPGEFEKLVAALQAGLIVAPPGNDLISKPEELVSAATGIAMSQLKCMLLRSTLW
ncbi:MAG: hypothetical protein B6D79_12980 [gamma proteobacterium symbiont of Ctena orbiculata]|nr:MAG: hypothetical protein B6D79_12980 [gamma proteobacterium symbiont of Ctena orbiculata]